MLFNLELGVGISLILLSFFAEFVDNSFGMGYGTLLAPLLLIFGFPALQVIPAILISQLVCGIIGGMLHHSFGNVDLIPKKIGTKFIPHSLKIVLILFLSSLIGMTAAVLFATNIPEFYLKLYIGLLVIIMGLIIIIKENKTYNFSWLKIFFLGFIASFNKGTSGGGYGPIVASGQFLSGIKEKKAVGITSMAEGLTCAAGIILYLLTKKEIDWILAPYLVIGAILVLPLAAYTVKKVKTKKFRKYVGFLTIVLGSISLIRLFFKF